MLNILSKKEINFHIIHNYTSLNKGWATIVISTAYNCKKIIPNANFTIESRTPEIDKKLYQPFGIRVTNRSIGSKSGAFLILVKALFWRLFNMFQIDLPSLVTNGEIFTYYNSDVILDLVGDTLSIPFGPSNIVFRFNRNVRAMIEHAYLFVLCLLLKKPIVIYAQTIGPIGVTEPIVRILLNKMSLITVREEQSLNYLIRKGVNKPPVYLTADPAFSLPVVPDEEIHQILREEGIELKKPIVGICLSSETARYHFGGTRKEFAELFAKVMDTLVEKYNAQIVLIPFWGDGRTSNRA